MEDSVQDAFVLPPTDDDGPDGLVLKGGEELLVSDIVFEGGVRGLVEVGADLQAIEEERLLVGTESGTGELGKAEQSLLTVNDDEFAFRFLVLGEDELRYGQAEDERFDESALAVVGPGIPPLECRVERNRAPAELIDDGGGGPVRSPHDGGAQGRRINPGEIIF